MGSTPELSCIATIALEHMAMSKKLVVFVIYHCPAVRKKIGGACYPFSQQGRICRRCGKHKRGSEPSYRPHVLIPLNVHSYVGPFF